MAYLFRILFLLLLPALCFADDSAFNVQNPPLAFSDGTNTTYPYQVNITGGTISGGGITKLTSSQWSNVASGIYYNGGNVGIGTTNPGAKLQVVGTANFVYNSAGGQGFLIDNNLDSVSALGIRGGTKGLRIGTDGAGSLITGVDSTLFASYQPIRFDGSYQSFHNSGIEAMRITGGNVGIGTISPDTILSVFAPLYTLNAENPLITAFTIPNGLNSGGMYSTTDVAGAAFGFGLQFKTFKENVGLINVLKMQSNGNVGIGTAVPGAKLQVLDTGTADGAQAVKIENHAAGLGSTYGLYVGVDGAGAYQNRAIYSHSTGAADNSYSFYSDAGILYNEGNVGIGMAAPYEALSIVKPISTVTAFSLEQSSTQAWRVGMAAGSANLAFDPSNNNLSTPVMTIQPTGNVGIGTTAPTVKLQVIGGTIKIGTTGTGKVLCQTSTGAMGTCDTVGICATCTPLTGN